MTCQIGAWAALLVAGVIGDVAIAGADVSHDVAMAAAYDRAAFIENNERNRYYLNRSVSPIWIGDQDVFWYRRETQQGYRFTRVDAASGKKSDLFDHERLVTALQSTLGKQYAADALPLRDLRVMDGNVVHFTVLDRAYSYDQQGALQAIGDAQENESSVVSPDGSRIAFLRDFNLWVREVRTGQEKALTTDGETAYPYAVRPEASRKVGAMAEVVWAPDSKKLLTLQTDERQVKPISLIDFAPTSGWRAVSILQRQAQPGDENIPMYRMLVIDTETGAQTRIRHPNVPAVRMLDAPINGGRAWWSADGREVYFLDIERGEKSVHVIAADAASGAVRELFSESRTEGYIELGQRVYDPVALRPLPSRKQLIWYSERSGWPHLYLYDLTTGAQIRQLTSGAWVVNHILAVDEKRGEILIAVSGRTPNKNPYYQEIARVSLAGGKTAIVSSGDDHREMSEIGLMDRHVFGIKRSAHSSQISPSGDYWIETQVRPDKPARSIIRKRNGVEVAVVEEATVSGLPPGFQWPQPLVLEAADGVTPIQALIARPSNFDPEKRYPVIDHIYGGPQSSFVPQAFVGSAVSAQAVAELGFIVVVIDGRGTAGRSREFHEASYGAVETTSALEDHIAAIHQLASRYPYMDLERVGIFGASGGGYMAASAMLRFPEFYKVGVAANGNHDQRVFWHSWGERYQGLLAGDNYDRQANTPYVDGLKGKLLLIHGMLDFGVHPSATFQLMQSLIDANKDFDLILLPRGTHDMPGYAVRRQWDFFVRHLAGMAPPENYPLESSNDFIRKQRAALLDGREQ